VAGEGGRALGSILSSPFSSQGRLTEKEEEGRRKNKGGGEEEEEEEWYHLGAFKVT
jgi:hypothetical protein